MAEGFKIADGFVEVHAKYDRSEVDQAAFEVGQRSGTSHTTGFSNRLRDERGRFTRAIEDAVTPEPAGDSHGRRMGFSMVKGAASAFTGGFTNAVTLGLKGSVPLTTAFASNPYVAAAGLVIGGAMAIPAGAALTAGIALAFSGGVVGLGAFLVRDQPAVRQAAKDLGDTASRTFKEAATPMVTPVANALGSLRKAVGELAPDFKQMFATVAPYVEPLMDGLIGMVKEAMPGFLHFLERSAPMLKTLGEWLPVIGEALGEMFNQLAGGAPGATAFLGDFLQFVVGTIIQIGYFLKWMSQAYLAVRNFFTTQLPNAIKAAVNWVEMIWGKITSFFSGLWAEISSWPGRFMAWISGIGDKIAGFFSGLWAKIVGFGNKIKQTFNSIVDAVADWVAGVVRWFQALPGRISAFMDRLPGMIKQFFVSAFDQATYAIGYGIGLVVDFFIKLPGRIRGFLDLLGNVMSAFWTWLSVTVVNYVSNLISDVADWFSKLPGRAKNAISNLWDSLVSHFNRAKDGAINWAKDTARDVETWMRQLPGKVSSAVSSLWSSISHWFSQAKDGAVRAITDLVNSVVNWAQSLPGKISSALSSVKSAVMNAFSGAGSWLVSAGADLLRGIASGISSATGFVKDAAVRAGKNIVAGFKDALGISSPSTVMADQVGQWIPRGVQAGVERGLPDLRKAVNALLPDAVTVDGSGGAARAGVVREAKSAGSTYVFQEGAIVLDASKIKSVQDLVDLIESLKTTARQYRARGLAGVTA